MIQELKIKNFLSFKDEATFSFEATKNKKYEDYQVVEVAPNVRLLRLAIVYGANGSGKTNLIRAFDFLRQFWEKTSNNEEDSTTAIPFMLDKQTRFEPCQFSLTCYIGATKYVYALELTFQRVTSERLSFYPDSQPVLIFDRSFNNGVTEITFNERYTQISQIANDEIVEKCVPRMSVISAYKQVSMSLPEMEAFVGWMQDQFFIVVKPEMYFQHIAEPLIEKDQSLKEFMVNFLYKTDFGIVDIFSNNTEEKVDKNVMSLIMKNKNIPEEEKMKLKKEKTYQRTNTSFIHRVTNEEGEVEYFGVLKMYESDGTLKALGLACQIKSLVGKEAFMPIDNIESSLHPNLIEFFIEDFFKQKGQSQLLLTTHYDGLLDKDDLLRRDSIWFAEKGANGSTALFHLSRFKGIKKITSLQKAYNCGTFGAIPYI